MTISNAGSSSAIICRTDELTNPTRFRNSRQSLSPYRSPSTSIVPAVGERYAVSALSSDVLPEPFAPRMAQCSPRFTRHVTSWRIAVSPRSMRRLRTFKTADSLRLGMAKDGSTSGETNRVCWALVELARNCDSTVLPAGLGFGYGETVMATTILVGAQWGDEGKGNFLDGRSAQPYGVGSDQDGY